MNVPLALLTSDMPSHGQHTGYGQLVRHLPAARVHTSGNLAPRWHRLHRLARTLGCPARYYQAYHLRFEVLAGWHSLAGPRTLAHFLYGEDQFWLLGTWRRRSRVRTVLTLHQPPSAQSQLLTGIRHLQNAEGVIVLSRATVEWAAGLAPRALVRFIPHGVDTDFFAPGPPPASTPPWQVLIVGGWLRDYPAAADCVRRCVSARPGQWRFLLIGGRDQKHHFAGLPVEISPRLTDEELRDVYRQSHLTLIPLQEATANNALLEATACGCPVVAPRIGGVPDYAPENAHLTAESSGAAYADKLLELTADPLRLLTVRDRMRQHALKFNWPHIARQTLAFHQEVCAGWHRAAN